MAGRKSKGSIFRADNGKWIVKQTLNGKTLKRTAGTKKEAKEKLVMIQRELEREDRIRRRAEAFGLDPQSVSCFASIKTSMI